MILLLYQLSYAASTLERTIRRVGFPIHAAGR